MRDLGGYVNNPRWPEVPVIGSRYTSFWAISRVCAALPHLPAHRCLEGYMEVVIVFNYTNLLRYLHQMGQLSWWLIQTIKLFSKSSEEVTYIYISQQSKPFSQVKSKRIRSLMISSRFLDCQGKAMEELYRYMDDNDLRLLMGMAMNHEKVEKNTTWRTRYWIKRWRRRWWVRKTM